MKNLVVAAIIGGLAVGCSSDSPTTPSTSLPPVSGGNIMDAATIERQAEELHAFFRNMTRAGQLRFLTDDEDFNCTNVEEVRVRFSDPGFVDRLNVGLFVKFIAIPDGTKTLRVWWDYDTAFDQYQDISVGDGDINPEDASRFDIEMVIEHAYTSAGTKRVRVELILEDETGNCARNREVVVTPESFDHVVTFGGVPSCAGFFGSRLMGLRVNFNPPIPAGTSYTVRFRVTGTGVMAPSLTAATIGNTAGPDFVAPPAQFAPPPNDFSVTFNPSVPHRQLAIATQIFSFAFPSVTPTSMRTSITGINIPGKTVGFAGTIAGSCP